ncbi:Uncharacterised protein [Raoultella terrigena]|uniref:Uncharacterized protein n=1 Tax=Raoultella terrigena TaxID=577 RepID=A0A4U9D788_RAOTE|nr:Uncharacterised protein [Raoultella terrigena]
MTLSATIRTLNGVMLGLDSKIEGNHAQWIVGAAAGFVKGDLSDRSGQVDQDSQTALRLLVRSLCKQRFC